MNNNFGSEVYIKYGKICIRDAVNFTLIHILKWFFFYPCVLWITMQIGEQLLQFSVFTQKLHKAEKNYMV